MKSRTLLYQIDGEDHDMTTDTKLHETELASGVLEGYRLIERLEWLSFKQGEDPGDKSHEAAKRWKGYLEFLGHDVHWTRCVIEDIKKCPGPVQWASVWMIAGVEDRMPKDLGGSEA